MTSELAYDEVDRVWRVVEHRKGDAIPTYFLVQSFLQVASIRFGSGQPWDRLLESLGIATGSAGEAVLERAVLAARELVFDAPAPEVPTGPDQPPTAFVEVQVERARRDVASMASLWARFLVEHAATGGSRTALEAVLEERIRGSMSMTISRLADDPTDGDSLVLAACEEFDDLLAVELAQLQSERRRVTP